MDILLNEFKTPFGAVPFSEVKDEDFLPAIKEAIKRAKAELELIKNNSAGPNFENVIAKMEESDDIINQIAHLFFNLYSADTNDKRKEIAKEFSPLMTEYGNDVLLDAGLFSKIKAVYEKRDSLSLTTEQMTLLTKYYKDFVRNGANLNDDEKTKLREIDNKLSKLKLEFGDHVLHATNDFFMELGADDLDGLPESLVEASKMAAKEKNLPDSWVITLDYPSYIPFMMYSKRRDLREKLFKARASICFRDGEDDNKNIVKEIANLRYERAKLLGYETHAHFVLEERMAMNPARVEEFLNDFVTKARPFAENELNEIKAFAKEEDGLADLKQWDSGYYSEKLKMKKFNIDDEKLKPYFKLENVINGAFTVANKLYGIKFVERANIPKYHDDVMTYEVLGEKGEHVGLFYADFFPRPSKRNGAWMTEYRDQKVRNGKDLRPHVAIVCNFTKPTESKPSLLTFNEVTTLFHEFGHALHGLLSKCNYSSVSGPNVYWDFVELPSQIMENWCFEKETLDLFATHYESGEPIPMELVTKIKESSNFLEGMATLRQLSFGILDMSWHGGDPSKISDVGNHEREAMKPTSLMEPIPEANMSCSFSHIFNGGYSSGYYSYKWAEVLDADAFEFFREKGIFSREVADRFRENILERGGTEHPSVLYKRFRGKDPSPDALLKRAGLLN